MKMVILKICGEGLHLWTAATETAVLTVENKARSGQRLLDFRHCYLVVQPNPSIWTKAYKDLYVIY
jgi:hypothetical protein